MSASYGITPRPEKFGQIKGTTLDIRVDPVLTPAEAMQFALDIIHVAQRYITIENRTDV